jgi:putative DNA primase/helicase
MGEKMNAVSDDVSRIEAALACIPADLPRDEWARIGAALKHELGDGGFDLFDTWSQRGESYDAAAARSTWRSLSASGGVTINTLFFKAIENGFEARSSNASLVADPGALERRRAEREQRAAKEAGEREARARNAATLAVAVWNRATPAGADHPYLMRKGVQPSDTLREIDAGKLEALIGYQPKRGEDLLTGRILIAPVRVGGKLSTLEMIDGDGRKSALAGGVKAGGYWAAQKLPEAPDALLIAEGVATALSASQCGGHPAIASLSVGQMESAAQAIHERYPDAALAMLADLDKATGEPHPTAVAAAQSVGARLAVPDFGVTREPDQTDFNDMHVSRGVDAVKAVINAALVAEPVQPTEKTDSGVSNQAASDAPVDAAETDDEAITRLAGLSPMQFDRVSKAEAKRMGVKVSTLEKMVKEARGEAESDDAPLFDEVEPWHEPVDGAALLSEISRSIQRFIVCDVETVTATALWCVAAWLIESVNVCPILLINAPEKACGKTQLLTVTGRLVPKPAQAAGISPSVLFRMIEKYQPTLLVDEIETVLTKEAEDLRGLLNAGHTRDSAFVWRSVAVGDDFEPKRFNVYGFKALAGINADRLAETITSRSVVAQLRRKLPHENVERLRHAEPGLFDQLKAKIARWAEDNADAIRRARPDLPDALGDREQDNWEPLLAVADLAGGTWPAWSRKAAIKLCARGGDANQSNGANLLADIQEVFEMRKVQRISMSDLLAALIADEEKQWATWRGGRPMTPRSLGKMLADYGIKSKAMKLGYEVHKGFEIDQFHDAFSRYLPSSGDTPPAPVTRLPPNAGAGSEVTEARLRNQTKNPSVTVKPLPDKEGNRVTEEKGDSAEKKSVTDDEAEDEL